MVLEESIPGIKGPVSYRSSFVSVHPSLQADQLIHLTPAPSQLPMDTSNQHGQIGSCTESSGYTTSDDTEVGDIDSDATFPMWQASDISAEDLCNDQPLSCETPRRGWRSTSDARRIAKLRAEVKRLTETVATLETGANLYRHQQRLAQMWTNLQMQLSELHTVFSVIPDLVPIAGSNFMICGSCHAILDVAIKRPRAERDVWPLQLSKAFIENYDVIDRTKFAQEHLLTSIYESLYDIKVLAEKISWGHRFDYTTDVLESTEKAGPRNFRAQEPVLCLPAIVDGSDFSRTLVEARGC